MQKLISIAGLLLILLIAAVSGTVGKHVAKSALTPRTDGPTVIAEAFQIAAKQINARGPIMLDKETRLNGAAAGPGSIITYFFQFPNYSSRLIFDSWDVAATKASVIKDSCASKEMKPSLDAGATYVFAYAANDNVEVLRFPINASNCVVAQGGGQPENSSVAASNVSGELPASTTLAPVVDNSVVQPHVGGRLKSRQSSAAAGDLRACLSLSSDEAVARCVTTAR